VRTHICLLLLALCAAPAGAQPATRDIPYATPAHERQVLDVYAPPGAKQAPVVFWIHGGGWQTGHKGLVARKPQAFTDAGLVFVSINHRLLPQVDMGDIVRDVAKAMRWVHEHVAEYGGDPSRVLVMGHSSGGQLAALICTDDRYLKAEGLSLAMIKGCVPVDADTFDVPAIIEVAETRARVHGLPMPTYGHRLKFGNDPARHRDFSAVTHVAPGKGIAPFLILHVAGHPDTSAQAQRMKAALEAAGVPATVVGARESTHAQINDNIGVPDDPTSQALFAFVRQALAR
jgi:acetyl esterase/lipase